MIAATPPEFDDVAAYSYVAEHRFNTDGPRAKQLEKQVIALYDVYNAQLSAATVPTPHNFAEDDQDTLEKNSSCLSHVYFRDLRTGILKAANGICAYCNNNKANEVDHFFPKAVFGEYSVYSLNLTPICSICNKKKLNRYRRAGGERRYLHPYFDKLLESEAFLKCRIEIGKTVVTRFEVTRSPAMSNEDFSMLSTQFTDLKLSSSYSDEATEEMMARLGSFYAYYAHGSEIVQKYIETEYRSTIAFYGNNHWLPALLRALSRSPEFYRGGFQLLGEDPLL